MTINDSAFEDQKVSVIGYKDKEINYNYGNENRQIFTSVIDYGIGVLQSLIKMNKINLNPDFQRRDKWSEGAKSRLIESFLMNIPVPPIYLVEDSSGKYSIIDGKQRLTAINDFFENRLKLEDLKFYKELEGKFHKDLPEDIEAELITKPTLRAVIVLRQSPPDIKYEVFRRLNTGGIVLNNQEIRNSLFPGNFNNRIIWLSESDVFYRILGIKDRENSKMYKEMKDVEFITRFFTFQDSWEDFDGGIEISMNKYMEENQYISDERILALSHTFLDTLRKVNAAFGVYSFRRWNPKTDKWRSAVIASLFDAQMIACKEFDLEYLKDNSSKIIENMKVLFRDDDFQKSINASIPSYFKLRIRRVIEAVGNAGK